MLKSVFSIYEHVLKYNQKVKQYFMIRRIKKLRWKKDRVELLVQSSNHRLMINQRGRVKTKETRNKASIEQSNLFDGCFLFYLFDKKVKNYRFLEIIRPPPTSNFVAIRVHKKSEEIMRKKFIKNQKYFLVVANRLPELYLKCVLQRKGKAS